MTARQVRTTSMVRRVARIAGVVLPALFALRCSFTADDTILFQQTPVSDVTINVDIQRSIGAPPIGAPRLALAWQLYFAAPTSQVCASPAAIDTFPETIALPFSGVLATPMLNRGFANGYGNYVLGAALIEVFDDLNHNGAYDSGEPIVGGSSQNIIVYFQGTATQDLLDQFGALQQGYNLCVKTVQIKGVDLFQTISPANYTASVSLPKDVVALVLPKLY